MEIRHCFTGQIEDARGVRSNVASEAKRDVAFGLVLVIFLVGMALRLYGLDADSLWWDEIKTVTTSRLDLPSILDFQVERSVHPPLLYIVTHFFLALLGDSDSIARLPAALFGSLSILLAYKVGKLLWTTKVGVVGAFLLAVNAYHVQYSQEVRHYSLMVFLALLSLIFILQALQRNDKKLWIGFAVCTSLSIYTHYFAFLVLPTELLYAGLVILTRRLVYKRVRPRAQPDNVALPEPSDELAEEGHLSSRLGLASSPTFPLHNPRKQALNLLASLAIIGVSYLPWMPCFQRQILSEFIGLQGLGVGTVPRSDLSLKFFHSALTSYSGVDGVPLLLFLGLLILGLVRCRARQILLIALWIGVPFLFTFVVSAKHFFDLRYTLFVVPIYLLTIAVGVTSVGRLIDRSFRTTRACGKPLSLVTLAFVLLFGLLSVAPLKGYYLSQKADWRGTAAYLQQNMREQNVIIADGDTYGRGGDAYRTVQGLTYYSLPDEAVTILQAQRGLLDGVQEMPDTEASAWGVLWHASPLANSDRVSLNIKIVEFPWVTVVGLLDPTGNLLRDTVSVLQALLVLQPHPEGRFDLHLALAQLYLRTGLLEGANSQLRMAGLAEPDDPRVLAALEEARLEFDRVSRVMEEVQHPLGLNLGGVVALLGYDVRPTVTKPGESLSVTLWWQTVRDMARDYTVFIHVIDQYGAICAQQDTLLRRGDLNTSAWKPGDMAREEYKLRLGPEALPGEYSLKAGIYYWETGERLPVLDANGERLLGDAIDLGCIEVTE